MKIGSININGVNAFGRTRLPGAWEFFGYFCPDILCIQETKGDINRVKASIGPMMDAYGYLAYVADSKGKKGYSGTAILVKDTWASKNKFTIKSVELGDFMGDADPMYHDMRYYGSGRIVQLETEDMYVISLYTLNSCSKNELRKLWDKMFLQYIKSLNPDKKLYILGDFNVCHTNLDMWNWCESLNTSPGLMDFEIEGFAKLLSECNLVDTFRHLYPNTRSYSWSAPKVPLIKGWRLDYALTNDLDSVKDSTIVSDIRCSDHVYIELIIK